jgi:hypothetical protein
MANINIKEFLARPNPVRLGRKTNVSWNIEWPTRPLLTASVSASSLPVGGDSVRLNWQASGSVDTVLIYQSGVGYLSGIGFSGERDLTLTTSTSFIITAIGPGGATVRELDVTVEETVDPVPVIIRFWNEPDFVYSDDDLMLNWEIEDAAEAWIIDNKDGTRYDIYGTDSGNRTILPTMSETLEVRSFTLFAKNGYGEVSRDLTVTVFPIFGLMGGFSLSVNTQEPLRPDTTVSMTSPIPTRFIFTATTNTYVDPGPPEILINRNWDVPLVDRITIDGEDKPLLGNDTVRISGGLNFVLAEYRGQTRGTRTLVVEFNYVFEERKDVSVSFCETENSFTVTHIPALLGSIGARRLGSYFLSFVENELTFGIEEDAISLFGSIGPSRLGPYFVPVLEEENSFGWEIDDNTPPVLGGSIGERRQPGAIVAITETSWFRPVYQDGMLTGSLGPRA